MEFGDGDELGVLHIHQILSVEGFGGQLAVAEQADFPLFVPRVLHLHPPYLVGGVQGHVIQRLGFDAVIARFDLGIGRAVAGDGLKLIQRLFNGPPGGAPEIAAFLVPQVHVPARLVKLIEHIAQDAPCRAGFDEAVAAGVLGDDGAVCGRAQIIGPGHGRAGIGDQVFTLVIVKVSELHGEFLLFRRFRNLLYVLFGVKHDCPVAVQKI